MWRAPVHYISLAHRIAGMAGVEIRSCMVPIEAPLEKVSRYMVGSMARTLNLFAVLCS